MRCGEKHRRGAGGESWWLWLNDATIKKCSRAGRSLGHARDILRRRRNEKINLFLAPAQLILPVYQSRIISFTPQSQSTLFNHRLSNNNTTPPWNSSICYGHVHLWSLPSLLCPWVVMLRRERALPIRRTRSNMMVAVALLLNNALTPLRNDLFWSWFLFVVLRTGIRAGFFNWNLCFSRQRCQMFSRICRRWQWISFHHELLYRVSWEVL